MRSWSEEIPLANADESFLLSLKDALAALPQVRLDMINPLSLVITERRRPSWAFWLAVFLFPFGLLCLLYKRTTELVVSVSETPEGLRVAINGEGSESVSQIVGRGAGYEPDLLGEGGSIQVLDDVIYRVFRFVPSLDRTRLIVMAYVALVLVVFSEINVWPITVGITVFGYFAVIAPMKRWERRRQTTEDRLREVPA